MEAIVRAKLSFAPSLDPSRLAVGHDRTIPSNPRQADDDRRRKVGRPARSVCHRRLDNIIYY